MAQATISSKPTPKPASSSTPMKRLAMPEGARVEQDEIAEAADREEELGDDRGDQRTSSGQPDTGQQVGRGGWQHDIDGATGTDRNEMIRPPPNIRAARSLAPSATFKMMEKIDAKTMVASRAALV